MDIFDMRARAPWPPRRALHAVTILRTAFAWWYRGIEMPSTVPCRRRPGSRPCPGRLRILLGEPREPIRWSCGACGARGEIRNWFRKDQEPFGAPGRVAPRRADWVQARISPEAHDRLLRSSERMGAVGIERTLRAATMAAGDVCLDAPRDDMEWLRHFADRRVHAAKLMDARRHLERAAKRLRRALETPARRPRR